MFITMINNFKKKYKFRMFTRNKFKLTTEPMDININKKSISVLDIGLNNFKSIMNKVIDMNVITTKPNLNLQQVIPDCISNFKANFSIRITSYKPQKGFFRYCLRRITDNFFADVANDTLNTRILIFIKNLFY